MFRLTYKIRYAHRLISLVLVLAGLLSGIALLLAVDTAAASLQQSGSHARSEDPLSVEPVTATGIREVIPTKYKRRYATWKSELLSTEAGRSQWERYAHDPHFTLTITISIDSIDGGMNGKTTQFKWDTSGRLIAATITLGGRIDHGYPPPNYYPVLNSLAPPGPWSLCSGTTLAAAKIVHEFGHVDRMAATDGVLFQLQTQLVPIYNSIVRTNGYEISDPRLIDLARRMNGTPVEIFQNNEHWAETNVLVFLADRFKDQSFLCSLFNRIRENLKFYANSYAEHFIQIIESNSTLASCASHGQRRLVATQ